MAASSFGVDAESVRRHHFPNFDAFSSSSRVSLSTVAEAIEEEAAHLAGRLALELVDASSIRPGTDAYVTCRRYLRMQVAARIARDIAGFDSALAQSWREEVAAWMEALAEGGASFLGSGATASGSDDPDGPSWIGSSLEGDTTAEMSTTRPMLRKDDRL